MDAVTAGLLSDIIKIVGPAAIAAIATYKTAQSQYQARLEEIKRAHEFDARDRLYDYYKYRQESLAKGAGEVSSSLGQILAMATGGDFERDEMPEAAKAVVALFNTYHSTANLIAQVLLQDMVSKGLKGSEEHGRLSELQEHCSKLEPAQDLPTAVSNFQNLMEFYAFLDICNQLLLERQIEALFAKYRDA